MDLDFHAAARRRRAESGRRGNERASPFAAVTSSGIPVRSAPEATWRPGAR